MKKLLIGLIFSVSVFADLVDEAEKAYYKGDYLKEEKLYKMACEAGNKKGCEKLGYNYLYDPKHVSEKEKGLEIFKKLCDDGNREACGVLYQDSDKVYSGDVLKEKMRYVDKKLFEIYKKSCDLNNVKDCFNLGGYYYRGGEGIEKDMKKANELYKKACNDNYIAGCYRLGIFHLEELGVDKNITLAKEYLDKVCSIKDDYSVNIKIQDCRSCALCERIGNLYLGDKYPSIQSQETAIKYFNKASDLSTEMCKLGLERECGRAKQLTKLIKKIQGE